ncbi:LOW QUALITY PROTEIN: centrosomal protein Cep290 [Drosophila tropicalis]|uniref:LOW QUALITY PROTEIN: centrosomal protein Cep290 n=1 Tax=Drosophila tropicalis TaxID=46794 RepID=UPI0035ABA4F0
MDIPESVSVRKFREFNARQKQELYETLLELAESLEELPKKSLRKTLELTLAVMQYKGDQVMQQKLDAGGRLQDENEKLKRMLQKLEDDRDTLKTKTKELSEQIKHLEQRLREAAQQAEVSDKDSSDPLSELDKQEQLLQNIDAKNKHIKRLLREIETLQNQNIAQAKTIVVHEQELQQIKNNLIQLSQDITQVEDERKSLKQKETQQSLEISRLEGNVTFLEDERSKQDQEMRQILDKFESQCLNWKHALDEKDKEVNQLKKQLEVKSPKLNTHSANKLKSNQRALGEDEQMKLRHLLESREQRIEKLEEKLKSMALEMISSTKVMNQLCVERERSQNPQQPRACCQLIEERLRVANTRCEQLSEQLDTCEADNVLKSKQALHALNALESYKRGEDGLIPALRRCSGLEQKLAEREKQLRGYVQELNAMHEIGQENELLRRKLNIPEDTIVLASKNARAKQRNKDKQIERLMLKLRTSEELRLQLKLDKSEMRRQLMERQRGGAHHIKNIKLNDDDSTHQQTAASEVGEVPSSSSHPLMDNSPRRGQGDGAASSELQTRYDEVLAENETLRMGMYEILERLREYDATSEHITIDSELLRRLIDIMPAGTGGGSATPQRLQGQLLELKAREETLRQLLLQQQQQLHQQNVSDESETGELSSVQSLSEMPKDPPHADTRDQNVIINTATRPSTPTEHLQLPIISDLQPTEQAELSMLRQHLEEIRLHISADDNELKHYNQSLHDQLLKVQLQLEQQKNSYAIILKDYDDLLTQQKAKEQIHIDDKAKWSLKLEESKSELMAMRQQLEIALNGRNLLYTLEEQQQLEQRNARLSMHLAQAMEQLLGELKLSDICMEYGIIDDNYQVDYVTTEEYERQRHELTNWQSKQSELQRENKQLENLLAVAQEQIQSQQRLLNELTDNHINLRHLVADLQSTGQEKLMLAKMQRELDSAKTECSAIKNELEQVHAKAHHLQSQLQEAENTIEKNQKDFQVGRLNSHIKQKFLQRSLLSLREKYAKFTPLIFLNNFVFSYQKFQRQLKEHQQQQPLQLENSPLIPLISEAVKSKLSHDNSQQVIKLIKSETQTKLLEQRCESLYLKQEELQRELDEVRMQQASESEHWQTIQALFGGQLESKTTKDEATNTESTPASIPPVPAIRKNGANQIMMIDRQSSPLASPRRQLQQQQTQTMATSHQTTAVQTNGSLQREDQSVQTLPNEVDDKQQLQQLEKALMEAHQRIDELESKSPKEPPESPHSGVVEKTILSFHTLLLEKDQSIQKYQDLLQTEREQNQQILSKHKEENEFLKATVNNLNFNIKTKDEEILELKAKLKEKSPQEKIEIIAPTLQSNSDNELSDERIEELYEGEEEDHHQVVEEDVADADADADEEEEEPEKQDTEELKELPTLHRQIRELKQQLEFTEKSLKTREDEIDILKEKLKLCQEREKTIETQAPTELKQLRSFVEEKDKHIKDLMDTLKNFHEDQQRYMNDTSNFSAEQIAKLAANLNRTEATNKIYHTQVEALRRQLTNVTQREKQARELCQSLRQQLLKRPVVSIKTELNARVKNENLQKRIQQLEQELDDARNQLQRQQHLLDAKRTRSANEVGLWEKQKRWQQQAEKCKTKLEETEVTLDKTKALLQAARNTIARLEKEKHLMESKLGRGPNAPVGGHSLKCCRTPSCPNLQHVGQVAKFPPSPSESPETYTTGPSSECSSPTHHHHQPHHSHHGHSQEVQQHFQVDLIEALKQRVELQQRKILAMELEGRGSNALTTELEKLQERLQSVEAQNIRLEAKNLQLQLDTDLLRQSDSSERQKKRIKHLEDYILALKEEMARNESRRELCKCSGIKVNTHQGQSAEHTILSLRNLVEKLRSENKFLKDGRRSTESRSSTDSEQIRLQQLHSEALEKIASLQKELQQQQRIKCSQCNGRSKDATNEELKLIKEQLVKKTQLLQKAKVLLTRAAAKENVLREQLSMWKRKCSELQNVPVIEEISE